MLLLVLALGFVKAVSSLHGRAACQSTTLQALQWREKCPNNTVLVGPGQPYSTISAALQALPNNATPYTLLILPGTYNEQVNISRQAPITLLGSTASPNSGLKNTVTVLWRAATGTKETGSRDNAFTSALTVAPNLEASLTGSGPTGHEFKELPSFGNTDFRAYNIDFVNDYKPYAAGPSLAVSVSFANAGFYFCNIRSYQDTLYIGKNGNAYIYGGEVAGQTDFLYGFGTAWLEKLRLSLRNCGGGITAWKGTVTSFPNRFGVYINEARVERANTSLSLKGKCSLGRPWNDKHRSIFARCDLDDSIRLEGYSVWGGNSDRRLGNSTFMAEYANVGPGAHAGSRRAGGLSKVLSASEFAAYDGPEKVFIRENGSPNTAWIDKNLEE